MNEYDGRLYEPSPSKTIRRRIRIQVSEEGQRIAREVAEMRNNAGVAAGRRNRFGLSDDLALRMHNIGTLGEAAIREFLHISLDPMLINRDPKDFRKPTIDPNVWVRSTDGINKRLWLRRDDEPHPEGLMVFAPVDDLEKGVVVFAGWIFCIDGMKPQYWQQVVAGRDPQFYVPGKMLEPYSTLDETWRGKEQGGLFD